MGSFLGTGAETRQPMPRYLIMSPREFWG